MSLRRSERWIRTAVRVFDDDSGFTGAFCERSAWLWLIANAAWKDTRHRVRGTLHDVARGTLFVTVRDLMDAWGWGNTKVVNFLAMLEKQDRIKRETKTGKTLITICNYSSYQDAEENARQRQDSDKTAARQPQDTKGTKGTNIPELQTTDAARDLNAISDLLFEAGGNAINRTTGNMEVLSDPLGWIEQGADLEADILPTVRRMAAKARPQSIRSWGYFRDAVAEARDRRKRGLSVERSTSPSVMDEFKSLRSANG